MEPEVWPDSFKAKHETPEEAKRWFELLNSSVVQARLGAVLREADDSARQLTQADLGKAEGVLAAVKLQGMVYGLNRAVDILMEGLADEHTNETDKQ